MPLNLYLKRFRAMAAIVPKVVETKVEIQAIIKLLVKASITRRLCSKEAYHLNVKPVHTAFILESLKEYKVRIRRGKYRKAKIAKE